MEQGVSKLLKYKGYFGSAEYSKDDGVHFGRLQFFRGLMTYESSRAEGLEAAFRDAVDAYLDQGEVHIASVYWQFRPPLPAHHTPAL